ncbi:homoserine O-acetyltransferase [Saxibacter everestensis]|uniref:Homoserine O-acetyltransferase n=1 Tax=Saxibacter everestensis TaxID=2909229 RepID=A0ABY8QZB0_9MICO|nr:homoserine O-acetyltransferase [Brevibacteriaceae bacterium ZFBP1038]
MASAATGVPVREPLVADGVLRFLDVGDVRLESGFTLPDVTLGFETWGTLNSAGSNAVLIEHALTADSHVATGTSRDSATGWWDGLVGPGKAIDPSRWFIVAANMIGGCYGSTGPGSTAADGRPWGSRFPEVSIRDSVVAETRLADLLGVSRWHAVVGGSMGAMRALEWSVLEPSRVGHVVVLASSAYSTAEQIGWAQAQLLAIRQDPSFQGGDYYQTGRTPDAGLGLARRIAHITYRCESELSARFGNEAQQPPRSDAPSRFQVESYLDHQAGKLVARFDANSYIALTQALMGHDVRRGRGTLREALGSTEAQATVIAVDSDRLYPAALSAELAAAWADPVDVHTIRSAAGHDGFLLETDQLGAILGGSVFA